MALGRRGDERRSEEAAVSVATRSAWLGRSRCLRCAFATIYAMVEHATPAATMTEAFAWLATAMAVGGAVGAASAGLLVDRAGPTAGFALAGGAGALAVLTTMLRSRTLARRPAPVIPVIDTDTNEQLAQQTAA